MKQKKRIFFIIPSLTIGGAEKLTFEIANRLSNNFDVHLILFEKDNHFKLENPNVELHYLTGISTYSHVILKLIFAPIIFLKLLKLVFQNKPHIIYSVMERANIINGLLSIFAKSYVPILSIHTPIVRVVNDRGFIRKFFIKFFYGKFLRRNIDIVCVTDGVKSEIAKEYGFFNIHVINNFIDVKRIIEMSSSSIDQTCFDSSYINFLFVGRLHPVKQVDIIIEAFYDLKKEKSNVRLYIVGDGPEMRVLKALTINLGIEDDVFFLGNKNNPYVFMSKCQIFVCSSKFEGFGISILESMLLKAIVVSSNCDYGPIEILKFDDLLKSEMGYIFDINVKNRSVIIKNLTNSLISSISDIDLNDEKKKRAYNRALEFDINNIICKYEELFNKQKDRS